jgi:hypothetical protein
MRRADQLLKRAERALTSSKLLRLDGQRSVLPDEAEMP